MVLESWRMSAHCHEQAGDRARAWEYGLRALDAGKAIPAENRAQTTLPFVAEGLLRVAAPESDDSKLVEGRLAELLGTSDWRALLAAAVARG
jgi:hypothetical protein